MSDFLALMIQGILMGAEVLVHLDGPQRNFAALKWDERAVIDEEASVRHVTAGATECNHNLTLTSIEVEPKAKRSKHLNS